MGDENLQSDTGTPEEGESPDNGDSTAGEEIVAFWDEPSEKPSAASDAPGAEEKSEPEDAQVPATAETPSPAPRFDPVAVFLSSQSTSEARRPDETGRGDSPDGRIRLVSPPASPDTLFAEETDGSATAVADVLPEEEGEEFHDSSEEEPEEDEDHESESWPAPRTYRTHWFMRLFAALCWMVILGFLGVAGAGYMYYRYAQTRLFGEQPGPARTVDLTVQPGDSYRKVIARMKEAGLLGRHMGIDDTYLMRYLAWSSGDASRIRHGSYRLASTDSLSDVYARLIKGSQDHKLTIPEGYTVRQIADRAAAHFDSFDPQRFVDLTRDSAFITSLDMYVPSLEGYLLPGTYFFGPGMTEDELIRQMVSEFRKTAEARLKGLPKKDDLSFHEHVILASLIEREARVDEDRPMIASVIFNRLKKKMRLEIDATVNYALNDWRRLSYEDLKIESPFNTYKIEGLPPAPICNPRIESLLATYTAPESEFLFYVHRGDGHHAFARTYQEHQKNVKEFIRKRPAERAEAAEKKSDSAKP